jgi:chromosome segregation and condensation protein ScpB
MGRRAKPKPGFDRELSDLPAPMRWREFMMRVEAVIFAASEPVSRETLSALIGTDCNLDLLIADIRDELKSRPYELVDVAGGYQHRTRRIYGEVIRASGTVASKGVDLTLLRMVAAKNSRKRAQRLLPGARRARFLGWVGADRRL